jgi:hypothetical protein
MRSLAAPRAGLDASSRKRTHELLQSLLNSFVLAFEVLIRDAPKRHQAPSLEPVSPGVRPLQLIQYPTRLPAMRVLGASRVPVAASNVTAVRGDDQDAEE